MENIVCYDVDIYIFELLNIKDLCITLLISRYFHQLTLECKIFQKYNNALGSINSYYLNVENFSKK